ncbi:MAG: HDOD domain-containing protein [Gammaproteobacteria bacterium]|nr:HDOD domain-containing protein [Gammaproteobacteria bacterium]
MKSSPDTSSSIFNDILESIEKNRLPLPTQPKIAIAIQELSENPNVTVEELNEVIGKDPGLTARIIRIANSPLVRGRVSINTLKIAISRLGTSFVANMAIGLAMEQLFCAKNKYIEEKMRNAWQHSGEVAAASYVLANYSKAFPPEEAMLAGLLHEIGILPILTFAEKNKELIEEQALLALLLQKYSFNLGEAILMSWQFPRYIAEVPMNLSNPLRNIPQLDLADIVLVAKIHALKGTQEPLVLINKEMISAYNRLGLDPNKDITDYPEIQKQMDEVSSLFA